MLQVQPKWDLWSGRRRTEKPYISVLHFTPNVHCINSLSTKEFIVGNRFRGKCQQCLNSEAYNTCSLLDNQIQNTGNTETIWNPVKTLLIPWQLQGCKMFTPENGSNRQNIHQGGWWKVQGWGTPPRFSFYSQQICKPWVVRSHTGLYINIHCSSLYIHTRKISPARPFIIFQTTKQFNVLCARRTIKSKKTFLKVVFWTQWHSMVFIFKYFLK